MNAVDLMIILGSLGVMFRAKEVMASIDYFSNMIETGRVIIIYKDGDPYAVMTFSITNDYEPFFKKKTWDYLAHDPSGKIIYIEKLVSKGWDRTMRIQFQDEISEKYPNLEYGVWHRIAQWGDRKVITKRRLTHV